MLLDDWEYPDVTLENHYEESRITLELSREGAMRLLALLAAYRDGKAISEQLIHARDHGIFALENQLYPDAVLLIHLLSDTWQNE